MNAPTAKSVITELFYKTASVAATACIAMIVLLPKIALDALACDGQNFTFLISRMPRKSMQKNCKRCGKCQGGKFRLQWKNFASNIRTWPCINGDRKTVSAIISLIVKIPITFLRDMNCKIVSTSAVAGRSKIALTAT